MKFSFACGCAVLLLAMLCGAPEARAQTADSTSDSVRFVVGVGGLQQVDSVEGTTLATIGQTAIDLEVDSTTAFNRGRPAPPLMAWLGFWLPDDAEQQQITEDRIDAAMTPIAAITAYPSPFRTTTTLRFDLAEPTTARLAMYDLSGRLVARLDPEPLEAGHHDVVFDGRGRSGRPLPSGTYLCRLERYDGTVLLQGALQKID